MPLFKVMGTRIADYSTTVSAADKAEAYDIATTRPTVDWTELETDATIVPDEVVEVVE